MFPSLRRFAGRGAGFLVMSFVSVAAFAVAMPPPSADKGGPLRMLDARVNLQSSYDRATSARPGLAREGLTRATRNAQSAVSAFARLQRTMPNVDAQFSSLTGAPEVLENRAGALTDAAPGASNVEIVTRFLAAHGDVYGLDAVDRGDLVVLGDSDGVDSGLRLLRLEQRVDGRPVFQSETRFLIDRDGRLVRTVGVMVPHARETASRSDQTFVLGAGDAIASLLQASGRVGTSAGNYVLTSAADAEGRARLVASDGSANGEITARQVLFPLAPGVLVPAWSLVVFTDDADWYAIVDAKTGDLLWRKNIRNYASTHDARFRVYVQADGVTPADSPAPASPNTIAPGAGTQVTEIAPTIVSMMTAQDLVASPNGWINDCPAGGCTANETSTLGNNGLICMDRTGGTGNVCDTDAAGILDGSGRPTGNPDANARNRDFLGTTPRDFQTGFLPAPQGGNPEAGTNPTGTGAAQISFRRGSTTHLFYLTNWYHDKLYRLGFDEAAANFQQTNFSGSGLGNDRVLGDAQDGGSVDNANFATPPDGTSGRMQMYLFTGPTIDRDGSLDAEIVLHELTHGTSNRLVGNGAGLNWDQASGMGEGWSDYYALSLLNNTQADDPNGRYTSGGYATYKIAGITTYLDNYVYGIRRFPYSTNNAVNPMTWADVDDVTNDLSGGMPGSPLSFNLNGGGEVHNIGELWALSLWEVRARIIADPAGANGNVATGNDTALRLVTNGLKMTPLNPTFTSARDAIVSADCATNACANEDSIWGGFADRGLGYGASSPYFASFGFIASHLGVRESFSLPRLDMVAAGDLVINDAAGGNGNGRLDPGEAATITIKLTNPWRRATRTATGVSAVLSTATAGVNVHDANSAYADIAPLGNATGDTFLVSLENTVPCGRLVTFTVTTTSSLGTTSFPVEVRVGNPNGTDPVVTYTKTESPVLAIPDARGRGAFSTQTITDSFEIADVDFRVDSLTHTWDGDVSVALRSPRGLGNDFISLIGAVVAGNDNGDNLINTVVDDDLALIAGNDLVQQTAAGAPYSRSWLPTFNGPWATSGFGTPPDPVGNLSRFDGTSVQGTWTVEVADSAQGDTGSLATWSMLVTPRHFDCAVFAPSANVAGTMGVSGSTAIGGTVTYTVTLTNSGSDAQNDNAGAEYTDVLPAGLTLVSATAGSGVATANVGTGTVTWNGALAPLGGSVTITYTATINAGTAGQVISNNGQIAYDANNDNTNEAAANTNTVQFTVGGSAAVAMTKTVAGAFTNGGTVTYTLVRTNTGTLATGDNAGDEVVDTLPARLAPVGVTASGGTATISGNIVRWNGATPAGGSVTITITATVTPGATPATVSNQASFAYDADNNGTNETTGLSDDPAVGGAADPTVFTIAATANVTLNKSVAGAVAGGSVVAYTLVRQNTGSAAAPDSTGDEVVDVLPSNMTLISAGATSGTATANVPSNTVRWNGATPAGGSVTIAITARLNNFVTGTVSNQASYAWDADGNGSNESTGVSNDPATGAVNDPTTFTALGADLQVSKTNNRDALLPGDPVAYTIVFANGGPGDAATAMLTDTMPPELSNVTWTCVGAGGAVCPQGGAGAGNINLTAALPVNGTLTFTVNATVGGSAGGFVSNTASIASTSAAELDPTDDSATDSDPLLGQGIFQDGYESAMRPTLTDPPSLKTEAFLHPHD